MPDAATATDTIARMARPEPAKHSARADQQPPKPRRDLAEVIDVAITVFTERGYEGTSIADLAKATGLAKSSIYHHVRSKQELLELAVDRAMGNLLARTSAIAASGANSLEQLQAAMQYALRGAINGDPNLGLIRRLPAMAASVPSITRRYAHYEMLVSSFVRRAAEDGYLRQDISAERLNRLLWLLGTAAADMRPLDPNVSSAQLAEQAISLLLEGALQRPDKE